MSIRNFAVRRPQTAEPSVSLRAAAQQMQKQGVGCLVVVEGKKPIGVVTDRDIALHVLVGRRDAGLVQVGEIASRPVRSIVDTASIADAASSMRRHGLRRLPVVDQKGELVGLLSQDDLLRAVATEVAELGEALRCQLAGESARSAS
jgi:CBS domain-containing protein